MSNSELKTYDLTIGEDIKGLELGLTKMQVLVDASGRFLELRFYDGRSEPIKVQYGKDLTKSIEGRKHLLTVICSTINLID